MGSFSFELNWLVSQLSVLESWQRQQLCSRTFPAMVATDLPTVQAGRNKLGRMTLNVTKASSFIHTSSTWW